jgi:hypothetical protein
MSSREETKQLLTDEEIHSEIHKILRSRIEKAIENRFNGIPLRNDEGIFYIAQSKITNPSQVINDVVNYLIDELSEKAILLNDPEPIKRQIKPKVGYSGQVF